MHQLCIGLSEFPQKHMNIDFNVSTEVLPIWCPSIKDCNIDEEIMSQFAFSAYNWAGVRLYVLLYYFNIGIIEQVPFDMAVKTKVKS